MVIHGNKRYNRDNPILQFVGRLPGELKSIVFEHYKRQLRGRMNLRKVQRTKMLRKGHPLINRNKVWYPWTKARWRRLPKK